jgi:hypothetical protein
VAADLLLVTSMQFVQGDECVERGPVAEELKQCRRLRGTDSALLHDCSERSAPFNARPASLRDFGEAHRSCHRLDTMAADPGSSSCVKKPEHRLADNLRGGVRPVGDAK